ncbi:M16 family metallopeptidase [Leptolyngbya sp. PCC 6406]|uniref:M16 family metallopeptidase n=1 Tax=Leptolyngbya sp. PCC 6406 TaxID=1173264 RepID=UPI0002AD0E8F|nr:pitrilysin family protein [Leptolyngbya sp. PCC 6406]
MTSAIAVASPTASTVPTIRRLDNGLTIIAEQMPVEAVNLNLWVRVGSAVESDAINGMAHFLEHMIFKGTAQLPIGEFERRIEARGGVTNAATSQDYTHFYITTAPQDFATLAPLQIDLVMNPLLMDAEFERERPVILEEIRRANDNPRRRTFYRSMEMAFDRLPYRRPVLGPTTVIEGLQAQQMRDFHGHWYQPERITAVAVGNLPVEELIQVVADSFEEAMAHRASLSPHCWQLGPVVRSTPEAPFSQIHRTVHIDDALQQARLILGWRVPGVANLEHTYALDVLASVLGRGRTARLVQDLREERQWVTSISASNLTYWQQGVFSISAQLPIAHLEQVEAAIATHITQVCAEPITEAELRRIQTQVANRHVFGSESPSDRAGLYGYYHTLTGNLEPALAYPQAIQALTPKDIQVAAQAHLSPTAYGAVILRPDV